VLDRVKACIHWLFTWPKVGCDFRQPAKNRWSSCRVFRVNGLSCFTYGRSTCSKATTGCSVIPRW
jgi:hypothetical protein